MSLHPGSDQDAIALLTATAHGDDEGFRLVLDSWDLRPVVCLLTKWFVGEMRRSDEAYGTGDPKARLERAGLRCVEGRAA